MAKVRAIHREQKKGGFVQGHDAKGQLHQSKVVDDKGGIHTSGWSYDPAIADAQAIAKAKRNR